MSAVLSTDPAELKAILDSLGWPSPESPASSPPETFKPAAKPESTLAAMLGLTGTVALGDHLDRIPVLRPAIATEASAALHRQLLLTMLKRHSVISQRIDRRYNQAFSGLRPVPNAVAVWEVLVSNRALEQRDRASLLIATQKLIARYRFLFSSTMGVIRKEVFWLRDDVTRILTQHCAEAEPLLELDRVLTGALEQATGRTQHNLEEGVGKRFAESLIDAIIALPDAPAPEDLDCWYERRGFITRFLLDCRRLTKAILNSDWHQLRCLVEACCGPLGEPLPPIAATADSDDSPIPEEIP